MRLSFMLLALAALACVYFTRACEETDTRRGCKINGVTCTCGVGCKNEYIYKTKRACMSALRGRSANICKRMPCIRGICIQTVQEPGFTCKCEGTGQYGIKCEKNGQTVHLQCVPRFRRPDIEAMYHSEINSRNGNNETTVGEKGNWAIQLCGVVYPDNC